MFLLGVMPIAALANESAKKDPKQSQVTITNKQRYPKIYRYPMNV